MYIYCTFNIAQIDQYCSDTSKLYSYINAVQIHQYFQYCTVTSVLYRHINTEYTLLLYRYINIAFWLNLICKLFTSYGKLNIVISNPGLFENGTCFITLPFSEVSWDSTRVKKTAIKNVLNIKELLNNSHFHKNQLKDTF